MTGPDWTSGDRVWWRREGRDPFLGLEPLVPAIVEGESPAGVRVRCLRSRHEVVHRTVPTGRLVARAGAAHIDTEPEEADHEA